MRLRVLLTVLVLGVFGCSATRPAGQTPAPAAPTPADSEASSEPASAALSTLRSPTRDRPEHAQAKVPVSLADPQWGDVDAPVTIVEISDFQCPFCARVQPTLATLRQEYGGAKLRLVFKHNPLPFHKNARQTANVAAAVQMLAGSMAFFQFHDLAFSRPDQLTAENLEAWAAQAGVAPPALSAWLESGKPAQKVDADIALAKSVGASGTPAFRINGVTLSGAQPIEKFREVIDAQLAEAERLTLAGTPPRAVYAMLTDKNYEAPRPTGTARDKDEEDTKVWQVPVLPDDPVRGPKDALVTIVVFSEFQCPFCKRVEATLGEISKLYPKDVRLVWKDNPLPFHPRAKPAAVFARFALQKKGNDGFWRLHDALFANQPELEDDDFQDLAKAAGLSWPQVKAAIDSPKPVAKLEESQELANDVQARGTPHFFINGRRLSGAQPLEAFTKLIDEQLVLARALAERVPRAKLYAELMKTAEPPPPPERKQVALRNGAPSRGDAKAPIVIQMFSDFQCPFCKRVEPTLNELEKDLGKSIRIVWRHLPLPFHSDAKPAAEAAEEVLAQKGEGAFWQYHDLLFEAQGTDGGLARDNLARLALSVGVDLARFEAALDNHVHAAKVDADAALANQAGINGTPAFLINDYYLSGAQPAQAFKKLIKRALKDRGKP